MQSIAYIPGSNQLANASVATLQNVRSPGATTNIVNTVSGFPTKFYATMGTPHTFTDPVTGEVITLISEATARDFAGHLDSGKIEIDAFSPGNTDIGSAVGDIIIVRPVTEWANNIYNLLLQSHKDDGVFKDDSINSPAMFSDPVDPVLRQADTMFDFVASGAVLAGLGYGSTLTASLSAGVCYINGYRQIIAVVATRGYTATKDTYVDALYNASGTATIVYTEVTPNAASPALAANSIRLGIIQSGANIASVAAINQGQIEKLLPIASSIPYAVTDSLGNMICPRDPNRRILGYRQVTNSQASITAETDLVGAAAIVNVPLGRKLRITFFANGYQNSTTATPSIIIHEDGVQIYGENAFVATATGAIPVGLSVVRNPSAGVHTYKIRVSSPSGTGTLLASTNLPAGILIELE